MKRKQISILFLGGAKRVSMGRKFIESGKRLGFDVKLFSYELSPFVPVAEIAEIVTGCRWSDPSILEDLHRVVGKHGIDILVPFVDGAVEVAARYRDTYGDAWVPVGDAECAAAMFDKRSADEIFRNASLPVPRQGVYPLIAKPRHGSASKGIRIIETIEQFRQLNNQADYLFQEYIADREEITVDCYVALDGVVICAVPRVRIETQGGEATVTRTFRDAAVEQLAVRTLEATSLKGAVTIQMLRDKRDGRLMLMEINPRLGGGAVCSCHAGADLPGFILRDATGMPLQPCTDWKSDIMITRYLAEVAFDLNPADKGKSDKEDSDKVESDNVQPNKEESK